MRETIKGFEKRRPVIVIAQRQNGLGRQWRDGRFEARIGRRLSAIRKIAGKDDEISIAMALIHMGYRPLKPVICIQAVAQLGFGDKMDVGKNNEFQHQPFTPVIVMPRMNKRRAKRKAITIGAVTTVAEA